jgi:hypothetical protein
VKYCSKNEDGCNIELFSGSNELPEQWNAFLPREHFLQKDNLAITELSSLPDLQYIYILISKNETPVAAVYFQVLTLNRQHLDYAKVTGVQNILWWLFTKIARPKLLVAGHLFRHDVATYYYAPGITPFGAFQYYQQAIDAALRHSCALAVLVKDAAEELLDYFRHFAPQYLFLRNDISMELDIPASWNDISDYERALKHKYAQRLRKVRSAWDNLVVKELSEQEVAQHKEEIFSLYRQVSERQQVRLGFLSADFIVRLKQQHKGQLKIWAVYEQQKMIAFYSAWARDEVFDMFYIGFDYGRNADLQLYFNILFFSIEQAINSGKKKLVLGRTALDAKARLGCKPKYLSTFLYIRNGFIRKRVLALQQTSAEGEGAWEERHPFKTVK